MSEIRCRTFKQSQPVPYVEVLKGKIVSELRRRHEELFAQFRAK